MRVRPHLRAHRRRPAGLVVTTTLATVLALVVTSSPARALLGTIEARWPGSTIESGQAAYVTGQVAGAHSTTAVVLQQRTLGGWRTVERTTVADDGSFRLRLPTWWTGQRDYRVANASLDLTRLGDMSATWTARVVPTYDPAGRKGQHRYSLDHPTRWDPCRVIGYRVNKEQARRGWKRDVKGAFRRLSEATGFTFAYRGTTGRIPQNDSNSWFPSDTQIVIAWARPSQSSLLRQYRGAAGVGAALSSAGYSNDDGSATYRIIRGMVVIDSTMRRRAGFGRGITRGDVLLHELGHTMGLSHTGASRQLMYSWLTRRKARYGAGDRHALEKRGAALGCLTTSRLRTRSSAGPVLVAAP